MNTLNIEKAEQERKYTFSPEILRILVTVQESTSKSFAFLVETLIFARVDDSDVKVTAINQIAAMYIREQ